MSDLSKYEGDKQKELAAFYTPDVLVKRMFENVEVYRDKTFLDPAIGSGNLMMYALNKKVEAGEDPSKAITEIYGVELDYSSYLRCISRFELWGKEHNCSENSISKMKQHIVHHDALTYNYRFDGEKSKLSFLHFD